MTKRERHSYCPLCGEEVFGGATKCGVCGGIFEAPTAPTPPDGIPVVSAVGRFTESPYRVRNLLVLGGTVAFTVLCIVSVILAPDSSKTTVNKSVQQAKPRNADNPFDKYGREVFVKASVQQWFKFNLKDYDSLQIVTWGRIIEDASGGCLVMVRYRARNSFGGFVIENRTFVFNSDGLIREEWR